MKHFRLVLSLALALILFVFSGCAAKNVDENTTDSTVSTTENTTENTTQDITGTTEKNEADNSQLTPVEIRAKEIVDEYTALADSVFEKGYSNAEANEKIMEYGEALYEYGDDVVDAIVKNISASYEQNGGVAAVDREKLISSVKSYSLYHRKVFVDTADTYYNDIIHFQTGFGTAGETEYCRYYFRCATDYFNKMIELSHIADDNNDALLYALSPRTEGRAEG